MNKKIALQLRNLALGAMVFTLFTGYLMQLTSRTPQIGLNTGSLVYASESTGSIDVKAVKISHKNLNKEEILETIENLEIDKKKVKSVESFLASRGAPLASKAEYIVKCAEIFGIDYRLIPAISIVESSGGKHTYKSFNAWGWGGSNGYSFSSWEDGIYTVSKGLSRYYSHGAVTPYAIAPTYNPHTPDEWALKVSYLMKQM